MSSSQRPLVGRREELAAIARALDEAAGGFRFLSLVGEPGVGKTRLLDELAAAAAERALPTLSGQASELEQEMPLGVLLDALDDRPEDHGRDLIDQLGAMPADSPLDRYQTYRRLRRLLDQLAAPSGLVLILDDMHWADAITVEFLRQLVRHPPHGRVLVAIAYRPAQASPWLAALAEAATSSGWQLSVEPFDQAEVAEFLGTEASQPRCRSLYEASGGNPFYLEALDRMGEDGELLAAGDDRGAAAGAEAATGLEAERELPPGVRAALQVELTRLSATGQLVAQAAAVAADGDEFEPGLAAVAAERPADAVLEALDELVTSDLVRPAAPAGRFRFRHPLVRLAAYWSAGAGWRVAAHGRTLDHLVRLGAPATVRAPHAEWSGQFGDQRATTTLIDAARAAAPREPATAARWLEAALRLLPEHPGPADPPGDAAPTSRPELLLELARLQAGSGCLAEGRDTAREALRLLPADDHARRARAAQLCALLERMVDRPDEARAVLLTELDRIGDQDSPTVVPLRLRLAAESMLRGDLPSAQAVLDDIPENGAAAEPGVEVAVAGMRAVSACAERRIGDAIRQLETADQILNVASEDQLADRLGDRMDALLWVCWTDLFMGRYRSALRRFDRAVAVARSSGQSYVVSSLLAGQARAYGMLGQLAKAARTAREAVEVARPLGSRQALVFALNEQCLVTSWRGEDEAALRLGEEAVRTSGDTEEWWGAVARYARGLALINAGRLDDGAEAMREAFDGVSAPKLDRSLLLSCCEELARAEAARGRPHEAAAWADRADRFASPRLEVNLGLTRLARAHALCVPAPAVAAEHAREAAEVLDAEGVRIDAGRARLRAGLAYAEADDRRRARDELRAAAEIFAACGAGGMRAQAVRGLRRLGVRVPVAPGRRNGQELRGLSPRELEVARLVAEGYSNMQIADRLVVSLRTVETHVSHILAKLGASSRVAVVKALAQSNGLSAAGEQHSP